MSAILAGPIFFVIAISMIAMGVMLIAFLFRQGWALIGLGFICMGLAVPGWLTIVGFFMMLFSIIAWLLWVKNNIGRSL